MNQNSLNIFKITSLVFIASLVIAIILFLIPKAGLINGIKYQDALKQAKEQNKPILITTYSKWEKKQKMSNQIIFSDKELVKYLDSNLLAVILDTDVEKDMKIINQYGINTGYSLMADKTGKPISFLVNSINPIEFKIFLGEIMKMPFFEWKTFEESIIATKQTNKPTICFVTSYINDNLKVAEILKVNNNLNYIDMNFYPVLLFAKYKADYEISRQVLGFDDPMIKSIKASFSEELSSKSKFEFIQSGEIKIVIIGTDKKVLGQTIIDESFEKNKNIQELIEKTLYKGEQVK